MPSCIVRNCEKREAFHKFPKNADMRLKWASAVGLTLKELSLIRRPVLCKRHFLKSDYLLTGKMCLLSKIKNYMLFSLYQTPLCLSLE